MNRKLILMVILVMTAIITITVVLKLNINKENIDKLSFSAYVIENNISSLLVKPLEGSSELNISDKIIVRVPENNAVLKDLSEFTEGSKVKIIYNGIIMESYPAQINAYSIELVSDNNIDNLNDNIENIIEFDNIKIVDLLFIPVSRESLKEGMPEEEWIKAKSIFFGELENQNASLHLYMDNEGNTDVKTGQGIIYGFIEHDGRTYEIGEVSHYGIDNVNVSLEDRNYDGIKEIEIAGSMGSTYIEMKIIAYNETNQQWENLLTMGSPEIIDLDNDGRDELLAVSKGSLPPYLDIYKWNNECYEKADISELTKSDFATLHMSEGEWIIETGIIENGKALGRVFYKYKEGKRLGIENTGE